MFVCLFVFNVFIDTIRSFRRHVADTQVLSHTKISMSNVIGKRLMSRAQTQSDIWHRCSSLHPRARGQGHRPQAKKRTKVNKSQTRSERTTQNTSQCNCAVSHNVAHWELPRDINVYRLALGQLQDTLALFCLEQI